MPASPPPDGKSPNSDGHIHQEETSRYEEKTGWAPRFGQGDITSEEAAESVLDHATLLESKLADKFFGGWSLSVY